MMRRTALAAFGLALVLTGCGKKPAGPPAASTQPASGVSTTSATGDVQAFFQAVEKGPLSEVQAGLDAHPEWVRSTAHRWEATPLHIAAYEGRMNVAELLAARGADVNAPSEKWLWRPIHEAAVGGRRDLVEWLIAKGADANAANRDGMTPLFLAGGNGKYTVVELLLAKGFSPDTRGPDGGTLLHMAAGGGDANLTRLMLDRKASVNARCDRGRTPLHWAATAGVVRLLTVAGAEIDAKGADGRTPLHLAAFFGALPVAEALLSQGADANAADANGRTPLHLAVDEARADLAAMLLAKGANVDAADTEGRTALHRAASPGRDKIAVALLAAKADPRAADRAGMTAADLAAAWENRPVEDALRGAGAPPPRKDAARAALAAKGTHTRVGPRGQLYLNGTPIVPFGVWQQPPYLMPYHRSLGIGCLCWPPAGGLDAESSTAQYVMAAEKCGLGSIVHFKPDLIGRPGVWGWIGAGWAPEEARRNYERVRSQDDRHVIALNFGAHGIVKGEEEPYFREALRYVDCVIPHVWPEMFTDEPRDLRHVAVLVDRMRAWSKDRPAGEVCIWPDLNPHQWFQSRAKGGTLYGAPTPAEFDFQVWLALIHGADGVCIFPISFDPFVFAQIPAKMEEHLPDLIGLVRKFTPMLAAEESPLRIRLTSDRKDGIVDFTTRRFEGSEYVFLLNGQDEPQTVRLEIDGLGRSAALHDALKDVPLPAAQGAYQEKIDGLQLRVWRVTVAEATTQPAGTDRK